MSGARVAGAARRPARRAWAWTDRGGRFSPFKTAVLVLLCVPGLVAAAEWATGNAGAQPVMEVIHQTGLWAVRLLLLSLLISPARAMLGWSDVMQVRRMVGVAAGAYAAVHLVLYADDQGWHLLHVASEILRRFYLTIGFVALLGLLGLSATSTNGAMRRMGRRWKLLHRLAYPLAGLALFHFLLQSKADVSSGLVYCGAFLWMMLWRALPAGRDRSVWAAMALALLAAALTVGVEYLWYALATRIPPLRVLRAEAELSFGPHPAGQVLVLGVLAAGAVLARAVQREGSALAGRLAVTLGAVAGGTLLVWGWGLTVSALPDALPDWGTLGLALALAVVVALGWWAAGRRGAAA